MAETTLSQSDAALPESFGKRILVIDDVELVGQVVTKHLHAGGFKNVRFETDERLAFDVIEEFKPCLLYTSPSPRD